MEEKHEAAGSGFKAGTSMHLSLSRPRRFFLRRSSAFTLVEIMIVLVILGLLLAIAVPNLARARETTRAKSCISNLRKIQWAKDAYLMDYHLDTSVTPSPTDLFGADKYIKAAPACPSGGAYTIQDGDTDPICSVGGEHVLSGG